MWGPCTTSGVSDGTDSESESSETSDSSESSDSNELESLCSQVEDEQDVVHPNALAQLPLQEQMMPIVSDPGSLRGLTLRSGQRLSSSAAVVRARVGRKARKSMSAERASSLRSSGKQTLQTDGILTQSQQNLPSMKMSATPQVRMTPQGLRAAQKEGTLFTPRCEIQTLQGEEQTMLPRGMQLPLLSQKQIAPPREMRLPLRREESLVYQHEEQIPPWCGETANPRVMMIPPQGGMNYPRMEMAAPPQGAIPKTDGAVPLKKLQQRHTRTGALRTYKTRSNYGTSVVNTVGENQVRASTLHKPRSEVGLGKTHILSILGHGTSNVREQPKEEISQTQSLADLGDVTPQEKNECLAHLTESRRRKSEAQSAEILRGYQEDQKHQSLPQLSWQREQQQEQLPVAATYQGYGELHKADGQLVPEQQIQTTAQVGDEVMDSVSHHGYQLQGLQNPIQQVVGSRTTAAQRVQQWVGEHGHVLDAQHVQETSKVAERVGYRKPERNELPPKQHRSQNNVPTQSEVPAHPVETGQCLGTTINPPRQVEDIRVVQRYVPVDGQVPPYWSLYPEGGREKSQPLYAPYYEGNDVDMHKDGELEGDTSAPSHASTQISLTSTMLRAIVDSALAEAGEKSDKLVQKLAQKHTQEQRNLALELSQVQAEAEMRRVQEQAEAELRREQIQNRQAEQQEQASEPTRHTARRRELIG